MIPWMESSFLTWHEWGSNKEGLRGSSITGWYIKYTMGLRKAIHWPKSVFFCTHKSSDATPNHEEIRSILLRLSQKKTGSSCQWCPAKKCLNMPWKCQHDLETSAASQFSWVTGEWYLTIFHIFSWIELFIQLILGEWKTPRFTCKIHHPERPDLEKSCDSRLYKEGIPALDADVFARRRPEKNSATPRGWRVRY